MNEGKSKCNNKKIKIKRRKLLRSSEFLETRYERRKSESDGIRSPNTIIPGQIGNRSFKMASTNRMIEKFLELFLFSAIFFLYSLNGKRISKSSEYASKRKNADART